METTTRKYTINDFGCYGEGSRGIYLGQHVQELALSCGTVIEPIGPYCIAKFCNDADHAEEYNWRTDEALEWLNANMVEDNVCFMFFDGEFFLVAIEEDTSLRLSRRQI